MQNPEEPQIQQFELPRVAVDNGAIIVNQRIAIFDLKFVPVKETGNGKFGFQTLVVSKSATVGPHSQFSTSKIIQIILKKNSFKNMILGAHFLLLTFFENFNF